MRHFTGFGLLSAIPVAYKLKMRDRGLEAHVGAKCHCVTFWNSKSLIAYMKFKFLGKLE